MKPGYKQTEVGVIPEDWESGSLAEFWSVTDCKHVTAKFVSSGYPLASIQQVQSRFVDLSTANQTTEEFYRLLISGGRKPQPEDLIISRNATVGEMARVAEWHPPFAMGQDVCLLRRKRSDFSSGFMQAVFQSGIIAAQLRDMMVGSTFKRVNVKQIKSLSVPMPPAAEQEAIAGALSDADALIDSLEQLIAKKRLLKQGAMQDLLTGKKRLPGFVGEWVVKTLGAFAPLQRGFDLPNRDLQKGPYPVVYSNGIMNYHGGYQVKGPGVVTGRSGTIGKVTYIESNYWPHNTALWVTSFRECDPKFVYYLYGWIGLERFSSGSGVPTLNRNDAHDFPLTVPSIPEQTAIAAILSDMDAEIAALEAKLSKARQLKQGMIQELLTGKTRLV